MSEVQTIERPQISELMAGRYNLSVQAFMKTFREVAMPKHHNEAEFVSCCIVAHEHGLNPLTKEIYFMKTSGGQIQPIVSVDGWVKKCNDHPQYDGCEFEDHREGGELSAITARIHRKDRDVPMAVTEYMAECRGTSTAWKKTPARMLRHRAMMQAARYAFGFAGVMGQDEFTQWQDAVRDITPRKSSYAAKKDGETTDRFNRIRRELSEAESLEAVDAIEAGNREFIDELPAGWVGFVNDDLDDARERLSEEVIDPAVLLEGFDSQMSGCTDLDSLNEVWVEIEGHQLAGNHERDAAALYAKHEERIGA